VSAKMIAHRLDPDNHLEDKENSGYRPLAIKGTGGMLIDFASCCQPIPGDPIVGVTIPGKGIIVHREICSKVKNILNEDDHYLPVQWEETVDGEFPINLRIVVFNGRGVLAGLTHLISQAEGNIIDVNVGRDDGYTNTLLFQLGVRSRVHLARVIKRLRSHPSVSRLERYTATK